MAQPQHSTLHIDAALTNYSKKYSNDNAYFIASQLFPRVKVSKKSDKYFIYGTENLNLHDCVTGAGSNYPRFSWTLSNSAYYCEKLGGEITIPDEDRDSADPAINLEQDAVEFLTEKIDMNIENRMAALVTSTSSITQYTTLVAATQWSNYTSATSDPETAIKTAKVTIFAATGKMPNTIVLSATVAETLAHHPMLVELRKYTDPNLMTESGLPKRLFGLNVLVAAAVYNSAKLGATASLAEIWGDTVLVAYVNPNPGRKSLTLGVTFDYEGRSVFKYREDTVESDIVRVKEGGVDEVLIAAACGYLITDVLA
jgi:hypothetical protein